MVPGGRRSRSRQTLTRRDLSLNIHGVSVGPKIVSGSITPDQSVRIFVDHKLPLSDLLSSERIPKTFDGLPVDVVESPRAYLSQNLAEDLAGIFRQFQPYRKRRIRRLKAGLSVGRYQDRTGTLSYFCFSDDTPTRRPCVLTNAHLLGCFSGGGLGESLFQPGQEDGGCKLEDAIAKVFRHVPISTEEGVPNLVDAGLSELNEEVEYDSVIHKVGAINGKSLAQEGLRVIKHGRTTGLTKGIVTEVDLDILVSIDQTLSAQALFTNQISIKKIGRRSFSRQGDSGALVLDESSGNAVGLLFATSETFSYANHLHNVEAALGISI